MKLGFCLFTLLVAVFFAENIAADSRSDSDGWEAFKSRFGKKYSNLTEEITRRQIRKKNLALIIAHNHGGKHNFTLRENSFVDWTDDEYIQMLGFRSRRNITTSSARTRRWRFQYPPIAPTYFNTVDVSELPTCVNWTAQGWVGAVMNQGKCGSCWSYSSTGSIQSQYYNMTGKMIQLSQQNLIDCSSSQGNEGCNGGNMQNAFWYVQTNGIEALSSYPDVSAVTGVNGQQCAFNPSLSVTKLASWRNIDSGNELALQQAVALVGPVSAGIDASSVEFQYYSGGIYSSSTCGSSANDLDHAILVVGYGVYNNQPYWLIQNSWGTSWGINGYMMMARNENMCGIATDATFPVISQLSSPAPGVSSDGSCVSTQQDNVNSNNQANENGVNASASSATVNEQTILMLSALISLIFFAKVR